MPLRPDQIEKLYQTDKAVQAAGMAPLSTQELQQVVARMSQQDRIVDPNATSPEGFRVEHPILRGSSPPTPAHVMGGGRLQHPLWRSSAADGVPVPSGAF